MRTALIVVFASVGILGCATSAPTVRTLDPKNLDPQASYFVMSLSFVTPDKEIQEDGCVLKLFPADGQQVVSFTVRPTDNVVIVPMNPGIYSLREIECTREAHWTGLSIGSSTPVRIAERSVNYWGSVNLNIGESGNLSLGFKAQDFTVSELAGWIKGEGGSVLPRLRSAYNGKPIHALMFEKDVSTPPGINYSFQKGAKQPKNGFKPIVIDECLKTSDTNPIRIGHLKVFGHFQKGKSPEVKRVRDENTYSAEVANCVEEQFKLFGWDGPGFVDVTFNL